LDDVRRLKRRNTTDPSALTRLDEEEEEEEEEESVLKSLKKTSHSGLADVEDLEASPRDVKLRRRSRTPDEERLESLGAERKLKHSH